MSFDRRWLLTTAGSAFLLSVARTVEGARKTPAPAKLSHVQTEDEETLFALFALGFSKGAGRVLTGKPTEHADGERKVCWDYLSSKYSRRLKWAYEHNSLGNEEEKVLVNMAGELGFLTAMNLASEKAGTCGWDKAENPQLRADHIDFARDHIGHAVNSKPRRLTCRPQGAPKEPEYHVLEVDQPCPIC